VKKSEQPPRLNPQAPSPSETLLYRRYRDRSRLAAAKLGQRSCGRRRWETPGPRPHSYDDRSLAVRSDRGKPCERVT
jgi:hypothetical protein